MRVPQIPGGIAETRFSDNGEKVASGEGRRRPVDLVSVALWLLMAVVTTLMAWVVVRPIWDVTVWF